MEEQKEKQHNRGIKERKSSKHIKNKNSPQWINNNNNNNNKIYKNIIHKSMVFILRKVERTNR